MPVFVTYNSTVVGTIAVNSTISIGENQQLNWSSHQKRNFSMFSTGQFDFFSTNLNLIYDNDVIDWPLYGPEVSGGFTG